MLPTLMKLASRGAGIQTLVTSLQIPWSTCLATSAKLHAVEGVGKLACLGLGLASLWL